MHAIWQPSHIRQMSWYAKDDTEFGVLWHPGPRRGVLDRMVWSQLHRVLLVVVKVLVGICNCHIKVKRYVIVQIRTIINVLFWNHVHGIGTPETLRFVQSDSSQSDITLWHNVSKPTQYFFRTNVPLAWVVILLRPFKQYFLISLTSIRVIGLVLNVICSRNKYQNFCDTPWKQVLQGKGIKVLIFTSDLYYRSLVIVKKYKIHVHTRYREPSNKGFLRKSYSYYEHLSRFVSVCLVLLIFQDLSCIIYDLECRFER